MFPFDDSYVSERAALSALRQITAYDEYRRTGKSNASVNSYALTRTQPFSSTNGCLLLCRGNVVYQWLPAYSAALRLMAGLSHIDYVLDGEAQPFGVVTRYGNKPIAIMNGDMVANRCTLRFKVSATVSFACLGRFFCKKNVDDVDELTAAGLKALSTGKVKLRAFCSDAYIACSKADKRKISNDGFEKAAAVLPPPRLGYTLVHYYLGFTWHRPATTLFDVTGTDYSLLLGMDEGQYFGCQIAGKPKTLAEAYLALAPVEAVHGKKLKKGVLRQGEWFVIPVGEHGAAPDTLGPPYKRGSLGNNRGDKTEYVFGKEDPGSADHRLTGVICVGVDNQVYVRDFAIEHSTEQHRTLRSVGDQWYIVRRNRALRSVSQSGVD